MARRHYDIEVEIIQVKGTKEYEAALFDGRCDVIIEHLEYLYEKAAGGEKVAIFCAPSKGSDLELVVPAHVQSVEELKGQTMAVRSPGRPDAVTLWLRMMGLDKEVRAVIVKDNEVGRWRQWKKIVSGECLAAFISPLYLPPALAAGLKVLPVPALPVIGQFAQACLSRFAGENPDLLRDYIKAVIHALYLLTLRLDEASEMVLPEVMKRMKIDDAGEAKRRIHAIARRLQLRPYPTPEAVANTYEIATLEYPYAAGLNPVSLWDLHWVKELDDEGFIDGLAGQMGGT